MGFPLIPISIMLNDLERPLHTILPYTAFLGLAM